jgi:hypothetical protein
MGDDYNRSTRKGKEKNLKKDKSGYKYSQKRIRQVQQLHDKQKQREQNNKNMPS